LFADLIVLATGIGAAYRTNEACVVANTTGIKNEKILIMLFKNIKK
jgi:hypothetical protein